MGFSNMMMAAAKSMPKSTMTQSMPSRTYSSCSTTNMWWLKNCCSFSLTKLMEICSKPLYSKISKPAMSSTAQKLAFFNGEVVVHHILKQQSQREAMVLRGYQLHVSPARERRHEVLERRQVEGKEVDGRQGVPPAPGSSRDWMREQPSWRQMDGQGRAFPGNGNLAERRGRGEAVQGNNLENREQVQQQIVGCFPQQVDHLSSNQQVEASPAYPIQQFAGESSLPMTPVLNQRVFPVAAFNEGFAP